MSYYVVALEHGHPFLERQEFHELGCRLVKESTERVMHQIQQTSNSAFVRNLENVEIYAFADVMPGDEDRLPAWAKTYLPTEEYQRFAKVYFLNEVALRMYREGGVEFEVHQIIADEELPAGCCKGISAPYLPKE